MSDDFKPGDVVVCVDASTRTGPRHVDVCFRLEQGRHYRLSWVGEFTDGDVAVELVEDPDDDWDLAWEGNRFRKIDAADEQFTRQMRAIRPVREQVPA